MPKIACPQCNKVYNVPEQAVGQVATCKCGKKFRLGKSKSPAKPASSPPPAARVPEPAKTHDSFWDDAFDEPANSPGGLPDLAGAASLAEPETTRPLAPLKRSRPKNKTKSSKQPWQIALDIGFRGTVLVMPFIIWSIAHQEFSKSVVDGQPDNSMVFSTAIFLFALVVGVVLAKHGIGFDAGSMKQRLVGIGMVVGGIVISAVSIAITIALNYVLSGFLIVVLFGCLGGVVISFVGVLQLISGRDLSSETVYTRNLK